MSITTLVVDDEPIARRAIVRLLREDADIELLAECGDGVSAVTALRRHSPDLVFLDIQMPAMSGLEVVTAIGPERMPATVFVTAFEQYAVRAFEANAVDYLVKPFSRERFLQTLHRAKDRLASATLRAQSRAQIGQAVVALQPPRTYAERIAVRDGETLVLVDVDDIIWIRANRNTVQLHVEGKAHELRETMTGLAERLDPRRFVRVHRSAIINARRIASIQPWFNGHHVVVMDNGARLRMSRYQHESFLKLVGGER